MRLPNADTMRSSTGGYRLRRMRMFLEHLRPDPGQAILDVGGNPDLWQQVGYEGPVVFLNIFPASRWEMPPGCTYVQGDGRCLPYADGEFPIVFSNSTLEHVGNIDDQRAFAAEVRRVGQRYWVQTPNRRFPIEPHMNFPGFQWLPQPVARAVLATWPMSFHWRDGLSLDEAWDAVQHTRLLTIAEMRELFPEARIWREQAFTLTKSIVAYRA